jgi:diaminopimelate epimerase
LKTIAFQKWEATGNDFLFIDSVSQDLTACDVSPQQVRSVCDRHTGQGADGVVFYRPPDDQTAHMTIINADGSRGDMCGNALRCLAEILTETTGHECHQVQLPSRTVVVQSNRNGTSAVLMGEPSAIPGTDLFGREPKLESRVCGQGYLLSFGNPHFVVPVSSIPADWQELGLSVQTIAHECFGTGGINCGFVETHPDSAGVFSLRVFERGVGATQSCGSGACAASAVLERILSIPAPHRLRLSGGELTIGRRGSDFVLEGPARQEFQSTWEVEA